MTPNPFQGLKHKGDRPGRYFSSMGVSMTPNPFQGLKLVNIPQNAI